MKTIIPLSAALLLLAGACNNEDTSGRAVWRRTVEPHLTTTSPWHACTRKLSPGHVVKEAQCDGGSVFGGACNDVISSRQDANRMLVTRPQCTDTAIASLKAFSHAEAAALSDLAGAYYVRAQRKDNPADLLLAFNAARKAVALKPQPAGAQFNYALILEALSLNAEAIKAWEAAAKAESGEWAEEAREHRERLVHTTAPQWEQVRAQLDRAIANHNAAAARDLVAKFPSSSERYFEEEVLPSAQLDRVATFAEALSKFFNDRYFHDVAAALVNAHSDNLRQGHLRFAAARDAERRTDFEAAARLYDDAARLLRQAGSPQYLLARIGHAGQAPLVNDDYAAAFKELQDVQANAWQYPSVVARVNMNRMTADQFLNRYNDLLNAYDAAMTAYGRISDWEDRAAADARAISAMSVIGLKESAWREAFVAIPDAPRVLNAKTQHLLVGATATAAQDLGYPEAALLYHDIGVENARRLGPQYLVSALAHRAAVELRLARYDAAQRDVEEATQTKGLSPSVRLGLQARLSEVQGETMLRVGHDSDQAVAVLTRAIETAAHTEFTTFRAALYAKRAEAFRRLGRRADEEHDRREALRQLHNEEEALLSERKPGKSDDLWISYFSRFQDTYDLLIRQLIEEDKIEDAFKYAERARAYEPLDLVRKLPSAPAAFQKLATHADNVDIATIQRYLPPHTFLIEYSVFDDRTFAWILGRNVFTGQWLTTARRNDVKRWTNTLQNAASGKDSDAFDAVLEPAYEALLKAPLEIAGAGADIVIVPDRELRGLPFAALRDPDLKRYVIEDHTPSTSGSALLYVFALLRDRELSRDTSALLVGDPAFDPHSTLAEGLERLPAARREVAAIGSLYPRSQSLIDEAATPQQFLRLAGDNAIVHIAAHGVINGDAPSQSYLLFHGVLNAETLMNELRPGKTRLVVLGACSSARGLPVGAEGIAPLVRPFLGANVPGVIGALWDIDDATAAALLVSFHGDYRRGSDAAKALRDAQLTMLRSGKPGISPARIWAPFQAIGYASSPFASVGDIKKEKPP